MGVERPSEMKLKLEIETDHLPVYDLEQVSPDSEKSNSNNDRKLPSNVSKMDSENCYMFDYSDAKLEDLESPAFEPVEPLKVEIKTHKNDDDMDISDGSDTDTPQQMNEPKSNISSISGLTSNESNNSSNDFVGSSFGNMSNKNSENSFQTAKGNDVKQSVFASNSSDLVIDQDSELSQVSSETSTNVSNSNEGYKSASIKINDDCANAECFYGMSEETQMQKFNESSSSPDNFTSTEEIPQFNIKNEDIKFEGTERMNLNKFMDIEDHIDTETNDGSSDSGQKQSSNCKYKHQRERKSQSLSRTSKKDDHFTYKGKATARQRSHSKDSNDGFTKLPNKAEHSNMQNMNQSKSSNQQAYTECSNETANETVVVSEQLLTNNPVVIDQILIGNDLDLKSFIVENRDDHPFVKNIEKDIISTNKKKPKFAENCEDAKHLTKIRRAINLRHQKKIGTVSCRFFITRL